jgi:hypothetical protein
MSQYKNVFMEIPKFQTTFIFQFRMQMKIFFASIFLSLGLFFRK